MGNFLMGIEHQLKKVKIPGLSTLALSTVCLLTFCETSFKFAELAPHSPNLEHQLKPTPV